MLVRYYKGNGQVAPATVPRRNMSKTVSLGLVLVLTFLSGFLDARGFVYASRAWPGGQFDLKIGLAAVGSFALGLTLYIGAVRFMQGFGIGGVALQSAIWFVVTAIGIAAMDGTVLQWTRTQQFVGIGIGVALAWLITTTSATSGH